MNTPRYKVDNKHNRGTTTATKLLKVYFYDLTDIINVRSYPNRK